MENQYWAAKADIAKEILNKVSAYKLYMQQSGQLTDLRKSFKTYYYRPHIQDVDQSLKGIHINHYANLIHHVHTMVTSVRPAWEPRSINTDLASTDDTQLASGLLDFYMREKHIESKINKACELGLFLKEGWISMGWDATAGEVYAPNPDNPNQAINEGDAEVEVHNILQVIRDVNRKDMNHDWFVLEKPKNKWDLAAKYPELAEKIIQVQPDAKDLQYSLDPANSALKTKAAESDLIPVYELRHEKTPALPQGRLVICLDGDITLFDGPLPYKKAYVFPLVAGEFFENAFGHSSMMDIIPINDAFDMTVSAILSNQAANAVNNFQVPKGGAPKVTTLRDGMNVWEYDPKAGKLEVMDLLKTAPEVFNFATMLSQQADIISNVPPITKGIAPATMSGTAMALLQQQAIQSSSGVQLSYTLLLERVGTALIELLQTYAVVPRIAMITGKSKKSQMKSFSNQDLKGISRVIVDSANPLTKTAAGRVEIANNLLEKNMIKTPEQYIQVLITGNLEPLYQHDAANLRLMVMENERLMDGLPVQILITDDDVIHILEHQAVLASPEARENPKIVEAVVAHIQAHIDQGKSKDPALAAALKQASMYQAPPPAPGPGPQQGQDKTAQVMDNQNPITQQAEQTKLPQPAQPPQI